MMCYHLQKVDYVSMKDSEEFQQYQSLARQLQRAPVEKLDQVCMCVYSFMHVLIVMMVLQHFVVNHLLVFPRMD